GELAENVTKYTKKSVDGNLIFSDTVIKEIFVMMSKIKDLSKYTGIIISTGKLDTLPTVESLEEEVDAMRKKLIKDHLDRLNKGECRAESSGVFINLVSNLERSADHIDYVAHSVN
ncbi:MAG: Na/Pi cotransporter family protein, partial [Clostridia bacterium]|nr:Na/Pi cotransporter family protein [Clostridia bacterium]